MKKKGAMLAALLVLLVYPLLGLGLTTVVLSDDPLFPGAFLAGGAMNIVDENGLTRFENEHGIGPITRPMRLGAIDKSLASVGAEEFRIKCSGCHKLGERYVGPPLRGVTEFRSPAYIMNMMLNPNGMVQKHPVAKGLLAQYYTVMSPQGMDEEKARAVVEYLRLDFQENKKK